MSPKSSEKRAGAETLVQLSDYDGTPNVPRESGYTKQEIADLRAEYGLLRTYFKTHPDRYREVQTWLNQARYGVGYDTFLARNAAYAVLTGAVFFVVGVVFASLLANQGVFEPLNWPAEGGAPDTLSPLAPYKGWIAGGVLALLLSAVSALTVWLLLYRSPKFVVDLRRRKINYTLPHAIVFMYAMAHGGMTLFEVMKKTAEADDAYGEVANEFDTVVRDVELYGNDIITALQNARNTTPSENFEQFLDDMLTALDSGAEMSVFFEEQSKTYLDRSKEDQEGFLETLALLSEVFVTLLVAGPLFFVVLMIIIGLLQGGGTLVLLVTFIYVIFPAGLIAFTAGITALSEPYKEYRTKLTVEDDAGQHEHKTRADLDQWVRDHEKQRDELNARADELLAEAEQLADAEEAAAEQSDDTATEQPDESDTRDETDAEIAELEALAAAARGGAAKHQRKLTQLEEYDAERRWHRLRQLTRQPFESGVTNPLLSLVVSVPVAVLFVGLQLVSTAVDPSLSGVVKAPFATTTRLIVLPFLIAIAPVGLFYELRQARENRFVQNFPATLNILASANNMGVPLTDALEMVSRWSTSLYAAEFRKVRNDIEWHNDSKSALLAFANRLQVPSISRTVKLVAEGSRSSGDLGRVLSVAATDTRERYRIVRRRTQMMGAYVVVVVLGAIIYLGVISLLEYSFLSPLEELQTKSVTDATGTTRAAPASFALIPIDTYRTLLFHSVLIQSVGSGLIAGQLSNGSVLSGIKYAVGLVALSLLVFWVVIG
jgi:flagellar protein FlaJ